MKIKSKLVSMVLAPLLISSSVIGTFSIVAAEDYLNSEQETILKIAVEGFSGNVNAYKDQDVEITVFERDTRTESSINGVVGTKASDTIASTVLKSGNDYFSTNVDVNGESYYGYYVPTDTGMLFAGKSRGIILGSMNEMVRRVVLITLVLSAIFGAVGFVIANSMAKRIRTVSKVINRIADGDLDVELDETSQRSVFNDEIGEINTATRQMLDNLKDIIGVTTSLGTDLHESTTSLDDTAESSLTAINEVSNAIEEIANGLQEQNEIAQTISENINCINDDIEDIVKSADKIAMQSQKLSASNEDMQQTVSCMADSNQKVDSEIEDITNKIKAINDVMDRVKGIVAIIGDISSQTELLSLNASIEAARAGEHGKGFSVVARSIRDLSTNTSNQVSEITDIIDTLVKDFNECLSTLEDITTSSRQQKSDLGGVIREFQKLSGEITETSALVEIIQSVIDKTASEVGAISEEMSELASVSENSAASAEEINASIQEINALMNNVTSTVKNLNERTAELDKHLEFFSNTEIEISEVE